MSGQTNAQFFKSLRKYYTVYTGGFIAFVILLAIGEQMGMTPKWIGYTFLFATIGLYAAIGIMSRTADVTEYYVAGRRVPALFNGMATGADWMSAASFIAMAGGLYAGGYDGLAFIMGWTGGYVLVALFLAPYLRKFGQFTIPDFLGARYGGHTVRAIGVFAAILCSFTYVVAQVMGVGLITARFTGIEFITGVWLGLAGVLVCSFLGGMRAVTWTQVAQYIILIVAYMIPVVWLSIQQTGNPVAQLAYGQQMVKLADLEKKIDADPKELAVRAIHKEKQTAEEAKLKEFDVDPIAYYAADKAKTEAKLAELKAAPPPDAKAIAAAEKAVTSYPANPGELRANIRKAADGAKAKAAPVRAHAEAFPGKDEQARDVKRRNFLALILCLMVGTAALPHILMRYYTTPSVREARKSVGWSLFFIFLLYFTAPALAVLVKFDIYSHLVGSNFADLPNWIARWASVDASLVSIKDLNGDGIVQLAEISLHQDMIVLATPEIAGLPYVISGLVAAGGLAAALSTADGLLLTIANALSHDVYYKMVNPNASTKTRLTVAKVLLLIVAAAAASVAAQKPADILFLVGAAFSLAAAGFFPALVLGIFWKGASRLGAIVGMLAGIGVTFYYMATTQPWLRGIFNVTTPLADAKWFEIEPISAGIFGIPVGFALMIVLSLMSKAPDKETQDLVEHVRYPNLAGDIRTEAN